MTTNADNRVWAVEGRTGRPSQQGCVCKGNYVGEMGGEQRSNATLGDTGLAGAEWVSRRRMRFVTGSAVVLQNCGLDIGAEGLRAAGSRG